MSAAAVIETSGLRKQYGAITALHELTLRVPRGEVFGFLGPNGAGKTTAVKLLAGLTRATAGAATVLGRPAGDRLARRRLGYLPELFRFQDWLTPFELLRLHADLAGMPTGTAAHRAEELIELVGLSGRERDRIGSFSKGMQQRLGLAQALVADPELVILDEPTSALDPIGRRDVRQLIQRLKSQGVTVFLNSHLLSEVELVCDRAAIVARGRVVREGTLAGLLPRRAELEVRATNVSQALLAALGERWSVLEHAHDRLLLGVQTEQDAAEVTRCCVAHAANVLELRPRRGNLEDAFFQWVEESDGGPLDVRPVDAARSNT